jgi:hypothetical protein
LFISAMIGSSGRPSFLSFTSRREKLAAAAVSPCMT